MTSNNTRTNTAQQFTYEDLREWIEQADRLGELQCRRRSSAERQRNDDTLHP